jgi:hypothetical protein
MRTDWITPASQTTIGRSCESIATWGSAANKPAGDSFCAGGNSSRARALGARRRAVARTSSEEIAVPRLVMRSNLHRKQEA